MILHLKVNYLCGVSQGWYRCKWTGWSFQETAGRFQLYPNISTPITVIALTARFGRLMFLQTKNLKTRWSMMMFEFKIIIWWCSPHFCGSASIKSSLDSSSIAHFFLQKKYQTLHVRDDILRGLTELWSCWFHTFDYARHIGLDYFGRIIYI